ncbi:MAG: hypothetical protein ABR538_10855 [Candidatus Binatia bacterium]
MSDSREYRLCTPGMWAAMAVAVVGRVAFLADKPLWRDEAWVALIAADPLAAAADGRAAPLGFLFLTRLVAGLGLGPPEVSYRLLPLLCGLALLPLLAMWARALGASHRVALAAVWIAAGLQPFVYYSRELKSYDIDLLLAVLAPLLGMAGFGGAAPRAGARWAFLACVCIAPWVSFGGIFAVGALLAWGWLVWLPRADAGARLAWIAASAGFLTSFAAVYALALGNQASDPWMQAYWQYHLKADRALPLPRQLAVAAWQYVDASTAYLVPVGRAAVLAVAVLGAWRWPPPGRALLLFCYVGTAAVCVAAAVMDRYLLAHGRHLLFAAPVLVLWFANGLSQIGRLLGPRLGPALVLGLPMALSLSWTWDSVEHRLGSYRTSATHFFRLDMLHDVDAAIVEAKKLMRPDEPLLVSRRSAYAFQFYNQGRIRGATYCDRHCNAFRGITLKWLKGLDKAGWVMMSDEDAAWFLDLLVRAGFRHEPQGSARGVKLWKVEREPRSRRAAAAAAATGL